MDVFRTITVPANYRDAARKVVEVFGPEMRNMFLASMSADGSWPGTHFVSSGYLPDDFVAAFPSKSWARNDDVWVEASASPGNASVFVQKATEAGVDLTLAEVEAVFSVADSSDQQIEAALSRMGLRRAFNPADDI